jgi:hypothetical protein
VVPAEPHYWLNRLAPDFTLPLVDGGRLSLSDLRGYIVIVNFWSAECAWSRRADVLLVYRALTWESKGVRIVGIASNYNELESSCRPLLVLDRQGMARYIGALDDATQEARDARASYSTRPSTPCSTTVIPTCPAPSPMARVAAPGQAVGTFRANVFRLVWVL